MGAQQLGRYRIIKHLATGGMGEVYLAVQEGPAGFVKPAVVKRLLPHLVTDPMFVEMFLNEARLAAVLMHPNVVQIYGLEQVDDTFIMSMEFVHGRTVRAVRQKLHAAGLRVPESIAVRVCADALKGLHHAHVRQGPDGRPLKIVHRDMSPDNIMMSFDGVVKVLDFGIAKAAEFSPTTKSGAVKGKFAYMAPEQVLSMPLDPRVDVYAVGVILYELLAGAKPFIATSEGGLVHAIVQQPHEPLLNRAPDTTKDVLAVVEKALKKDPNERFESALAMTNALEDCLRAKGDEVSGSRLAHFLAELFGAEAEENPASSLSVSGLRPWQPVLTAELDREAATPDQVPPADASLRANAVTRTAAPVPPGRIASASKSAQPSKAEAEHGEANFAIDVSDDSVDLIRPRAQRRVWVALGGAALLGVVALALLLKPQPIAVVQTEPRKVETPGHEQPPKEPPQQNEAAAEVEKKGPLNKEGSQNNDVAQKVELPPLNNTKLAANKEPEQKKEPAIEKPKSQKAFLDVRVNPWGVVYVDGEKVGVTPFSAIEIAPGSHQIRIENPDMGKTRNLTQKIVGGSTSVVKVNFNE